MDKQYKDDSKMFDEYTNNTVKCTCGHSVVIRPTVEKVICTWCQKYVFRNKEDEFKYRIKEKLK